MKTDSIKLMKAKYLMCMCLGAFALSAQPLMVSTNFNSIDFNGDGTLEAEYAAIVSGSSLYSVITMVSAEFGVIALKRSPSELYFEEGAPVSLESLANGSPPLNTSVVLVAYVSNKNPFDEWQYVDRGTGALLGGRLTVYVGLRFPAEGGMCHGWLKFVRPDAQLPTLFTLDSSDWNPIPGAPIRAGFPPEIPIESEWLPNGETLRFTWPAALTSWVLESTPNLAPPVVWNPVDSGGGYADIATTEEGRFFRLRRP